MSEINWAALQSAAQQAAAQAYAPYSKFPVGVAVLAQSGKIYTGCNVENASYGGTVCAERNAIAAAVVAGERTFSAVMVYTPQDKLTPPLLPLAIYLLLVLYILELPNQHPAPN